MLRPYTELAGYPLIGSHQCVYVICMKYRIIIFIFIITIISLGQILLSYIANTSRTHARMHARTLARTHTRTHVHTHRRRRAGPGTRTHERISAFAVSRYEQFETSPETI